MKTLRHILHILFERSDHTLAFVLAVYSKWVKLEGKDDLLEWMCVSEPMKDLRVIHDSGAYGQPGGWSWTLTPGLSAFRERAVARHWELASRMLWPVPRKVCRSGNHHNVCTFTNKQHVAILFFLMDCMWKASEMPLFYSVCWVILMSLKPSLSNASL